MPGWKKQDKYLLPVFDFIKTSAKLYTTVMLADTLMRYANRYPEKNGLDAGSNPARQNPLSTLLFAEVVYSIIWS